VSKSRPTDRLDKWLWHARFFKTRTLAAKRVSAGKVRVNGMRASRPATPVGPGDALSFAQGRVVRVVRVRALGARRGPTAEAAALYEDIAPPQPQPASAPRAGDNGRPTKRARRQFDRSRRSELE